MQAPTDQQVLDYIASVPGLREEWGITNSKRLGRALFVVMNALLLALIAGAVAYFALGDANLAIQGISGLLIVLAVAYVASALRVFQLRAERRELPAYRKALADKLTGNPETDGETQSAVATSFKWHSKHYQNVTRMIGIAGFAVICINTYQGAGADFARMLLFDGAILAYLTGALWANFAFKADILEVELEERCRATMRWQREHAESDAPEAN